MRDDERAQRTHQHPDGSRGRVRGTSEHPAHHVDGRDKAVNVAATPRMKEALARLRAVFREMVGAELSVTDAARLAGLDDEVCHALLRVLRDAAVLEQRRSGVFAAVRN